MLGSHDRCIEQALTYRTLLERRLCRMLSGVLQWDHPFAGQSARLGRICCSCNLTLTHSIKVGDVVHDQSARLGCRQQLVLEIGGELGFLLIERTELSLVGLRELGAGTNEILVVELDEEFLLGVKAESLTRIVDALHSLEEFSVQEDCVAVGSELGSFLFLNALKHGVGIRAGYCVESLRHTSEQAARALHRNDRVVERRRC